MKLIKIGASATITALIFGSAVCYGATPAVSVKIDKNGKDAEILCENVPENTYSAQIELSISPDHAGFSITPGDDTYFCEIRNANGNAVIYLDYTSPVTINGNVYFGTIHTENSFSVEKTAKLLLADERIQKTEYQAEVSVSKEDQGSNSGGNSGGGSSGHTVGTKKAVGKPTLNIGQHGSVQVSADGSSITIKPDEGYQIQDVLVNGISVGPVTSYQFDADDIKREVQVIFEPVKQTADIPNQPKAVETFLDVPNSFWAKDAIDFAVSNGLFFGTGENQFSPQTDMTRAMFVTVLSRFEGAFGEKWHVTPSAPVAFQDVPQGIWYDAAVSWAGGSGLVAGLEEGSFAPDAPVTREQIAVILMKFAEKCGIVMPETEKEIVFKDHSEISPWAQKAVSAMQKAGVLSGREDGSIGAKDFATRAEVASMLKRFLECVSY